MVIGLDFDNTIVCYDEVFPREAIAQDLVPASLARTKSSVREYLRGAGREADWTRLQGHVYGKAIMHATPFPGIHDFLMACRRWGITVHVISHKTRYPVLGEKYDMHRAAEQWLEANGFFEAARTGLSRDLVTFELTKEDKLRRIRSAGCTYFVDDLAELLTEPGFPPGVDRILFDPQGSGPVPANVRRAASWNDVLALVESAHHARCQ